MDIVTEAIAEDIRRLDSYMEQLWRDTGVVTRIIPQPLCTFCVEHEVADSYYDDYDSWCNANEPDYEDSAGEIFVCASFNPREGTIERLHRYKIKALEETLEKILDRFTEEIDCDKCDGQGSCYDLGCRYGKILIPKREK